MIAEYTWDKYKLGLGVYTMQGFEWWNKDSKMTLQNFTNNKGNIIKQSKIHLWDIFTLELKLLVVINKHESINYLCNKLYVCMLGDSFVLYIINCLVD